MIKVVGAMFRSRSAEVSKVMQRSLRSLLSVDGADITGLMSGKVKHYVGELSLTQLSGNLVMPHCKTGLRKLLNNIYA